MHGFDTGLQIVITIAVAAIVQLLVRSSIDGVVRRVVRGHRYTSKTEEKKREDTLLHVFRPLSGALIWVIALIIVLSLAGVNLAALITGAGAIGLVFGIVAQSAFKDYIAGIYIILENQYRVGDVVMLAGTTSGVVEDISIRVTKLRDLDGNLHYVRNGDTGVITNMTTEYSNVNVNIGIGYDDDIDLAEKLINEVGAAMAKEEKWRPIIIEPIQFLRVDDFAESSVTLKVLGKVLPIHQWEVAGDFRRRIKKEFDKHGIDIPVPQRVVHQAKK